MTREELNFIGAMNECDEISNEAYEKIVNHVEETEISDDCVSRNAVDRLCFRYLQSSTDDHVAFYEHFLDLPSVTPPHGTCKDCKYYKRIELNSCDEVIATCGKHCDKNYHYVSPNFYCASYEKRG